MGTAACQPRPFDPAAFEATLAVAPAVISIHMEEPGDLVARARDCGIRWMQQVMDLDQTKQALERDVDAGFRGGGVRGRQVGPGYRDRLH